jgi:hypothetical protein
MGAGDEPQVEGPRAFSHQEPTREHLRLTRRDSLRARADRYSPLFSVWREFGSRIIDHDDNTNSRFEVAGDLNRHIAGGRYPCHAQRASPASWLRDVLPT